ncbi:NUDIX domain-containing protein [Actinopolymorpha sp. B11F2]|uniref:NUDIX hydrolase n=1 Tax=Actinopolymorpha sp. B11F2 TaxID=3160862 RepID=UPI0032E40E52
MTRVDFWDDPEAPAPNSIVPSVTAVVVQDETLLLIHKVDNDRWALPGGAIDLGESSIQAAVRETQEETGVEIEILGLIGVYTDPRHVMRYDDGEVRQQFSLCFRGVPIGGTLRPQPSETKGVRWVPFEELSTLDIHPSMRIRIDDGRRWQPGTVTKVS